MEQVVTDENDSKEDVVIYALKVSQHSTRSCVGFLSTHAFPRPHSLAVLRKQIFSHLPRRCAIMKHTSLEWSRALRALPVVLSQLHDLGL